MNSVAAGCCWCIYPPRFQFQEDFPPTLCRLAETIFNRQEVFLSLSVHADDHQRTQSMMLLSKSALDAIDPDIDPVIVIKPALPPGLILLPPGLLQPGHRTGREALGLSKASRANCISPVEMPFKYSHGIAVSRLTVLRRYGGTRAER